MIKMVVFDMAGTTIDEDNLVYKTVRAALQHFDCEADLSTVLSIAAGKEKREAISDTYEKVKGVAPAAELLDEIHQYFKKELGKAYDKNELKLFEGVPEVLQHLEEKGIIRIFNTGYTAEVARKILQKVGVTEGKEIEALITADMVSNSRPAPDMIQMALDRWKVKADQTIKVGDSKIDIEEGKNAGVRYAVGITTGAQQREELEEAAPDLVIDRIEEILQYID